MAFARFGHDVQIFDARAEFTSVPCPPMTTINTDTNTHTRDADNITCYSISLNVILLSYLFVSTMEDSIVTIQNGRQGTKIE